MSNDSSSSTQRPFAIASSSANAQDSAGLSSRLRTRRGSQIFHERRARNRIVFNKQREVFLSDLKRNLDLLIYAELSAIYHMDCSFLRLLLRAFVQFTFLTPKPSIIPEPPAFPPSRPVLMIVSGNALCIFLHAYFAAPSAGEATRGYLHGGLAMDFIGQKGPSSKVHLVLLDILLCILQILCLGTSAVQKKAKESVEGSTASAITTSLSPDNSTMADANAGQSPSLVSEQSRINVPQTLDDEERGQFTSDNQEGDIELRALNTTLTNQPRPATSTVNSPDADVDLDTDTEQNSEQARLLRADPTGTHESSTNPDSNTNDPRSRTEGHIFDAFLSGEIVVADLRIARIVKSQFALEADDRALDRAGAGVSTSTSASTAVGRSVGRSVLGFRARLQRGFFGE